MFIFCFRAQKNINNPVAGFINSFVRGKPQNENAARISILGASVGFIFSFILIWTPLKGYLNYLDSLYIVILGLIVLICSSSIKKSPNDEVIA